MEQIWKHVLHSMNEAQVEVPVLCGIGCGAFKGQVKEVAFNYGKALAKVLTENANKYPEIKHVVVTLPPFNDNNFEKFTRGFEGYRGTISVTFSKEASMIALADQLSRNGVKAGILNPSDAQAIRNGYIGMFWDGGHIAVEELLATQTTLLLQHRGVNPELFNQPPTAIQV
jgi:hypothetical protein